MLADEASDGDGLTVVKVDTVVKSVTVVTVVKSVTVDSIDEEDEDGEEDDGVDDEAGKEDRSRVAVCSTMPAVVLGVTPGWYDQMGGVDEADGIADCVL